jgi:D-sedoheptulose 7-phosphate isomerase
MTQEPRPVIIEADLDQSQAPAQELLAPDILGTDVFARDALAPDVLTRYVVTPEPSIDPLVDNHLRGLVAALAEFRGEAGRLVDWGRTLANVLAGGGRLLVAGNGGSATQATHLASQLVGRMHADRPAYSAIALGADSSTLTAIGNEYGFVEVFARQVQAHGRAGDVLVTLSSGGNSENLLAAVLAARALSVTSWALTGPAPNPLAELADDALAVSAQDAQAVRELHLLSVHLLCEQVDAALASGGASR